MGLVPRCSLPPWRSRRSPPCRATSRPSSPSSTRPPVGRPTPRGRTRARLARSPRASRPHAPPPPRRSARSPLYPSPCPGEKGDGKAPSSYGLRPPPRDFTKAIFKSARLRGGDDLPTDDDLFRVVRGGLHGTPMLPWDI